jgi:hypothetical protein
LRLFAREDEAATVEILGAASSKLLSYILEAVEEDASWFLTSVPRIGSASVVRSYDEDNDLVRLRRTTGLRYFEDGVPLERHGEPAPGRVRALYRSTEVLSRILNRQESDAELSALQPVGDPKLLVVFVALAARGSSVACSFYRTGLDSGEWLIRSATLDAMWLGDCATMNPEQIVSCVRDRDRIVRAKALQMLNFTGIARELPRELISEVAAMLSDPVCFTEARDVLCQVAEARDLGGTVLDAVGFEYTKYLDGLSHETAEASTENWYFLSTIDEIAGEFDCEQVSWLVDLLSSSSRRAEVALHALVSMDCPLPARAMESLKGLVSSEVSTVREHAVMLCRQLPEFDQELSSLLVKAAVDENESIRVSALGALDGTRLDNNRALVVFSKALTDESIGCRSIALRRLVELGQMARSTLEDYLKTLERRPDELRDREWVESVRSAIRDLE